MIPHVRAENVDEFDNSGTSAASGAAVDQLLNLLVQNVTDDQRETLRRLVDQLRGGSS